MQKGFSSILIIGIILVLVAVAGGAYYFGKSQVSNPQTQNATITSQPTTVPQATSVFDETANWKTYAYKNEFSLKYPNDWYIESPEQAGLTDKIRFFKFGEKPSQTIMMSKGNEQLIVSVENELTFTELQKQLNLDNPPLTIAGKPTLKYATGAYILLGPSEKRILSLYMPAYPNGNRLDQILSTFKFLDQNSSNETSDWKTFTNNKYTFRYPMDWILLTGDDARLIYIEEGKEYKFAFESGGRGGPAADDITNEIILMDGKSFNRRSWVSNGKVFLISIITDGESGLPNHLEITLPEKNNDKYLRIINQIISTFKFK